MIHLVGVVMVHHVAYAACLLSQVLLGVLFAFHVVVDVFVSDHTFLCVLVSDHTFLCAHDYTAV